jgi:hypothetical protein
LTPSPALLLADLTPASGRQNHTTWPYAKSASSLAHPASTASRPAFRDVRATPLFRDRIGRISELIWVGWQAKFLNFGNYLRGPLLGPNSSLRGAIATKQSILSTTNGLLRFARIDGLWGLFLPKLPEGPCSSFRRPFYMIPII